MSRPRPRLAVALVALSVTAAGCGGGDGGDGGARLSKTDYRDKIETISREFARDGSRAQQRFAGANTQEKRTQALHGAESAYTTFVGRLADLKPPERLQSTHDRAVTTLRAAAKDSGAAADALAAKDRRRLRSLATRLQRDGTEVRAALTELARSVR